MALIQCPDCGREVSSNAAACPDCGNPISAGVVPGHNTPHTTTERTKKKYKGAGCLLAIVACIGVIMIFTNMGEKPGAGFGVGIFITFISICGLVVVRFLTWWNHG